MDFQKVRPCIFCEKEIEIVAKGLCAACYQRQRKRGTPEYVKIRKPCTIKGCESLSQAHGLCATHLKRWQRHGHTKQTRPKGWGSTEKHPLYNAWTWRRRKDQSGSMCQEWLNDFWLFVQDVGDRPSNDYILRRIDKTKPYSKENFEWRKKKVKKLSSETQREYENRFQRYYRQTPQGKAALKNKSLKKQYGITLEEYETMLADQNGVCKICGNKGNMELAVDHCHKNGTVRGLLCSQCNTGLGCFKDSTELMEKAINYLLEFE